MRRLATALAIGGAVLASTLGVHPGGTSAASTGKVLNNPLILRNQVTGSQVQIMPTTAWLAQHASATSISSGSTSTGTSSSTPASCTLGTDNSPNDAHVVVNSQVTQFDSLDFTSFGLASDTSNITGNIGVESLNDGSPAGTPAVPSVAGGGDVWYIVWDYGNAPGVKGYFLEAEYPGAPTDQGYTNDAATSNLPVDFSWGTIITSATGGDQFQAGGPATGTFDTTNSALSITAPLSSVGAPNQGDVLSSPHTEGDALVGTSVSGGLLETADSLTSSDTDYHVGQEGSYCPVPKQTTGSGSNSFPTAGSTNNLAYFGGPIVHSVNNYLIWWLPKAGTTTYSDGSSCTIPATVSYSYEQPTSGVAPVGALPGGPDGDADYQAILQKYFSDVGGTAYYNLLTQYADEETGATNNSATLAGTWTDNCGYTSTASTTAGPVPGGTDAAPIYQADIQAEVAKAIQVNGWPDGLGNEYFVFTGYGAADCFAPAGQQGSTVPTCDVAGPDPAYCAYHGDYMDGSGNYVLYADMDDGAFAANPSTVNLCYSAPIGVTDPSHTVTINGQSKSVTDPIADAEVSITSHEENETVNDAEVGTAAQYAPPLGWYDEVNGEIGDKCAYIYGNYASDGSNIVLHGDHYIVQEEYSNWNNGCALTSYQGNGGYGGNNIKVPIQVGQNLISVPTTGVFNTKMLVNQMEKPGNLPVGSITQVQIYRNGALQTWVPGSSATPLTLARTTGIIVTSTAAGTWTPTGTPYTSTTFVGLNPGWNLVAATWPNPGLNTDSIFNQIEAETGACTAAVLTNAGCKTTINEIKTIGAGGATIDWKPTANSNGQAVWPQTYGNQIPFTSAMWIYNARAYKITWKVQGNECQSVDASGDCS